MTNAENKQQVVDDKKVVDLFRDAIAANDCRIIDSAAACYKALTDNGYIITRG